MLEHFGGEAVASNVDQLGWLQDQHVQLHLWPAHTVCILRASCPSTEGKAAKEQGVPAPDSFTFDLIKETKEKTCLWPWVVWVCLVFVSEMVVTQHTATNTQCFSELTLSRRWQIQGEVRGSQVNCNLHNWCFSVGMLQ